MDLRRILFICAFSLCCIMGNDAAPARAAGPDEPTSPVVEHPLEETTVPAPPAAEPPAPFGDIPTDDEGYTDADKIDFFIGAHPAPEQIGNTSAPDAPPATAPAPAAGAPATPPADGILTLAKACRLAVENHPGIEAAQADFDEAAAEYGLARSVYYPRVDWQTKLGPSKDLQNGDTEQGDSAVTVTQKLYHFGGIRNSVASARLSYEGAEKQHTRTCEEIAALALNAYLAVLQSEELVRVQQGALAFYKKLLSTFKERYIAGISSKADAKKVEISMRDTQAQLVRQNEQLSTSRNLLENIIYQPVSTVEHNVDLLRVNIPRTLEESYQRALDSNMSLQALQLQIESQRKSIEATRADYYPSLGYRLQVKNEFQEMKKVDEFTQTADAQLTLGWVLFDGHTTKHTINKKKAALHRLLASRKSMELDIRNVLTNAMNAYEASAAEHELAREAFESSVNLMSLYLSEFDLGIRTLLDLITAREGQSNAAVREVNARFARIRAAVNILLEEGRLGKTLNLSLHERQTLQ